MARPKVDKATVQFRLGREDKEFLDHYAKSKGQTVSEIVRGWVSEKITLYEHFAANSRAGKLLDLFLLDTARRAAEVSGIPEAEVLDILKDPTRQGEAASLMVAAADQARAGGVFLGPGQVTRGQGFKSETGRARR